MAVACAAPQAGLLPAWIVGIIFVRDAMLIGGATSVLRSKAAASGMTPWQSITGPNSKPLEIRASPLSKVNTFLQLTLVGVAMGAQTTFAHPHLVMVVEPLGYAVVASTALSLADYVARPGFVAEAADSAKGAPK
jgi:phosphatidylglycerophosphate synthase